MHSRIKFTEFFSRILFEEKKEESNPKKESRLKEIYQSVPIYYDTWCADKKENKEIKHFRESEEYSLFSNQIKKIIKKIKESYFQRQKEEGADISSPLTDEDFKPLDALADRLLNPIIVSDAKKNPKERSEAESMYSDGKRYLEGLLYQIETVSSFLSIKSVMEKLIKSQKDEAKGEEKKESKKEKKELAAISVCASGTRQNLMNAYADLLGATTDDLGMDHALLTAVKANAYDFMLKTPPFSYEGNEIHDNASLVNYFYKELKLTPQKIEDESAHEPVEDDKIFYAGTSYRARFKVEEAQSFVEQTNSISLIQGFLDFLTHKFQNDLKDVNNYDSATFFLQNLFKIGRGIKKQDIHSLRKRLFGFYSLGHFERKSESKLNDAQQSHIIEFSTLAIESHLKKDGNVDIKKLSDLCLLILLHPSMNPADQARFSADVLSAYKMMINDLLDRTDVQSYSETTISPDDILDFLEKRLILVLTEETEKSDPENRIFKRNEGEKDDALIERLRNHLLERYHSSTMSEELRQEERKKQQDEYKIKREEARLKRLAFYKQKDSKTSLPVLDKKISKQPSKISGRIKFYTDPDKDYNLLDNKKYCSLDQIVESQSRQLIKKPDDISKELRSEIFFLMLDGEYINNKIFTPISLIESKEIFHIIPNTSELSWVSFIDNGEEKRTLLPDYLNLNQQHHFTFLKTLILQSRENVSLDNLIKALDIYKSYSKQDEKSNVGNLWDGLFDQLNLTPDEYSKLDISILSRLALRKNSLAIIALYNKLETQMPNQPTPNDILQLLLKNNIDINMPESDFLKDIKWDQNLFRRCYRAGCRHFAGITLENINLSNEILFDSVHLENVRFKNVLFPSSSNTWHLKGAKLDKKAFMSLIDNRHSKFEDMILDDIDFRGVESLGNISFKGSSLIISFKGSSLINTNFSGINLSHCDFTNANLMDADLRKTTLEVEEKCIVKGPTPKDDVSFTTSYVTNFTGANLTGANLGNAIRNPKMQNTKMDMFAINTFLTKNRNIGRIFDGMNFVGEQKELVLIDFGRSQFGRDDIIKFYALGKRDFSNFNLSYTDLSNLDLTGSDFSGANLAGTNFSNSILEKVCFTNARIIGPGSRYDHPTKLNGTLYNPLYEKKLSYTIPFLTYQGKTPVETLINLLEHHYLQKGRAGRIFNFSWNKHYVKEINTLLLKLKESKQDVSIEQIYKELNPAMIKNITQDKGMLFDIFEFCFILEEIANKKIADNKNVANLVPRKS